VSRACRTKAKRIEGERLVLAIGEGSIAFFQIFARCALGTITPSRRRRGVGVVKSQSQW
jgi:hypothetical protein